MTWIAHILTGLSIAISSLFGNVTSITQSAPPPQVPQQVAPSVASAPQTSPTTPDTNSQVRTVGTALPDIGSVTAHILVPTPATLPTGYKKLSATVSSHGYFYIYSAPNYAPLELHSLVADYQNKVKELRATKDQTAMFYTFTYKGMEGIVEVVRTPQNQSSYVTSLLLHNGDNALSILDGRPVTAADPKTIVGHAVSLLDSFKEN